MVLTEKGFKRPTYDELLTAQENRAKELFGEDIDTSSQSIFGKFIRLNVYDLAECYELLEGIYYARFPGSARGQSLDRLCTFAGITRNPSTASRIKVKIYGEIGATIPIAFLLSGNDQTFYTDASTLVGADGFAECYANCIEKGIVGNIPLGTEITIVNPKPDLERVELCEISSYGEDRESDTALRARFTKSIAGSGSATVNAIRGALSRVALVDGVAIVENDTNEVVDGRPAHSFECYILAPESQDQLIAEAIFAKKPLGVKCVGEIQIKVKDEGNKEHVVYFSRTKKKMIHVHCKILTNQYFESTGVTQIKDKLLERINSLSNGETVYLSSLYGYIYEVHGVVNVQALLISAGDEDPATSNVEIGDHEVARCDADDIQIEVIA